MSYLVLIARDISPLVIKSQSPNVKVSLFLRKELNIDLPSTRVRPVTAVLLPHPTPLHASRMNVCSE